MHLVAVAPHVPYAGIDHAGGAYLRRYVTGMRALGWRVTVVAPDTPENEARVESCPVEVALFPAGRPGPLERLRRVRSRGTGAASPISPATVSILRSADVVDLHWHETYLWADQIRATARGAHVVATVHDVASVAAEHAVEHAGLGGRSVARIAHRALVQHEGAALNECDHVYVFKHGDIDELKLAGCHVPMTVSPPSLDLPSDAPSPDASSRRFVFSAALWRDVNHRSALWLLDEVWPRVLADHPDAELVLAGAGPRPELQARVSDSVELLGFTDSIVDGYRDCLAALAPVTGGAGLKFKVAQAAAKGFPIVGTSIAFDGFEDLVPGAWVGINSADGFARAIGQILDDPSGAIEVARINRDHLLRVIDFDAHLQARDHAYRRTSADPGTPGI